MAVKASSQTSIIDITDAYSVILTSETYTFVGNTSGAAVGSTCTTQAVAYCGATQCSKVNVTAANITCPSGITATVTNNGTASPTITFKTTAVISAACEATIPVVVDGITINKKFSFAVATEGLKGATGAAGKGIKSTAITYQSSSSGTTVPTGTWETSVPNVSEGQYLWTRTIITYTDNTTSTSYSVGKMGTTGTTGATGPQGPTGPAGKGIKSTAVTYQASSSGTTAPTGTWNTSIPLVSAGQYLWTKTVITYTDNTTSTSYSVGKMGTNGSNGTNGTNGKSIGSITNYYLATSASSNVTTSTSGWTTTVQSVSADKKYLWNYEVVKYSDGMTASTTAPCIIGAYGDKGNTGGTGATGNGISKITEHYAVSTSNSTAPTSWSETVPTMTTTNKYLWNYETITYTNGTTADTAKRVIGVYGNTGATGKGVSSTAVTYQASTSGTTIPTGTWSTTIPTVAAGSYLWTKTVITYTDKTTSTSYSIGKMGSTGSAGKGIKSTAVTYQAGASGTTAPTESWVSSPPATSVDKPYLWTKTVITYTDNTTSTSYSVGVPPNSVVSKGDVVNQVNAELKMEGTSMALKAGHFTIESDGLNLDAAGNATFKGAVKASSGEFTKGFSVNIPVPQSDGYGDAYQIFNIDENSYIMSFHRSALSGNEDAQWPTIYNTIMLGSTGVSITTGGNKSGIISLISTKGMLFKINGTGSHDFYGGSMFVHDSAYVSGTLCVTKNLYTNQGGVRIWHDDEGGNIRVIGPNNSHFWDIDNYENTHMRIFHYNGSSYDRFYSFYADGTFNGLRWVQIDASSLESGMQWTGLKGPKGSGNIVITCKPSGGYSQFLAYDNCANSFIWYYNTSDRYYYFNSTIRPMGNIIFDYNKVIYWGSTSGPKMYSTGGQHLYLFGSNEANYALHLGVHDGMWTLDPDVNGYLTLGTPNHRWGQIYSTSAAISTSDRNEKKDINALFKDDRYVKFFKKLIPVSFKMKNGESGRTHVGFISQDVEAAMLECGISDLEFAGFCRDQKTVQVEKTRIDKTVDPETGEEVETEVKYTEDKPLEGEYVYSLRYEEFIALNTAMIQHLDNRVEDLETRLSKLEAKLN